jgi:hypothetical protein
MNDTLPKWLYLILHDVTNGELATERCRGMLMRAAAYATSTMYANGCTARASVA